MVVSCTSHEHGAAAISSLALGNGRTAVKRLEVASGADEESDTVKLLPELWGFGRIESVFIQPMVRVNNKHGSRFSWPSPLPFPSR